jgi:hypothetical protein
MLDSDMTGTSSSQSTFQQTRTTNTNPFVTTNPFVNNTPYTIPIVPTPLPDPLLEERERSDRARNSIVAPPAVYLPLTFQQESTNTVVPPYYDVTAQNGMNASPIGMSNANVPIITATSTMPPFPNQNIQGQNVFPVPRKRENSRAQRNDDASSQMLTDPVLVRRHDDSIRHVQEFLLNYPENRDHPTSNTNLRFFNNEIRFRPGGLPIDEFHIRARGRFGLLEEHHG